MVVDMCQYAMIILDVPSQRTCQQAMIIVEMAIVAHLCQHVIIGIDLFLTADMCQYAIIIFEVTVAVLLLEAQGGR